MASETQAPSAQSSVRRRLGRGLGSLLSAPVKIDFHPPEPAAAVAAPSVSALGAPKADLSPDTSSGMQSIETARIQPNPKQPRQHFDEQALHALAASIASSGLMQPIVVREKFRQGAAPAFEIIAGERRWRAAQLAGLERIAALVRNVDDRTAAELSLVENLQREDLNPMERSDAFRRLIEEFGLSQQEVAQQVGLDRSSVSNHLRLQELDEPTKDAVRQGLLSLGHAKALLALTNISQRRALAAQALRMGWSVREVERRAKLAQDERPVADAAPAVKRAVSPAAANAADLQRRLSEHLGTKVQLLPGRTKGSGKLVIEFFNLDQFEGVLRLMQFETD
jgi:ParB family chromosome partitioning protein